jgi:hypothetical protein
VQEPGRETTIVPRLFPSSPSTKVLARAALTRVSRKYGIDFKSHEPGMGISIFHSNLYYLGHMVAMW